MNITDLAWWKAAGVRAIKTAAEAVIAVAGASALITEINWAVVGSSALGAAFLSLMISLRGLPELDQEQVEVDVFVDVEDFED